MHLRPFARSLNPVVTRRQELTTSNHGPGGQPFGPTVGLSNTTVYTIIPVHPSLQRPTALVTPVIQHFFVLVIQGDHPE